MPIEVTLVRRENSPERPYAVTEEFEPDAEGRCISTTTVFLTAAECPIGCQMCDLWQNTLRGPTPPGAIPRQIDFALRKGQKAEWIKLYNSGNFFDAHSIPLSDYAEIARQCEPFSRVVVENHPRIGTDRVKRFRDLLAAQLEVAVGLETVQPRWLDRLGKRMTRDDFDRYATWLGELDVDLRVFLIIGVPGIDVAEAIRWTRMSMRHAIAVGTRHVSLIPARFGHGWNGRGAELPLLSLDDLGEIQSMALEDAQGRAVVTMDLWDVDSRSPQFIRLQRNNLSQRTDIV